MNSTFPSQNEKRANTIDWVKAFTCSAIFLLLLLLLLFLPKGGGGGGGLGEGSGTGAGNGSGTEAGDGSGSGNGEGNQNGAGSGKGDEDSDGSGSDTTGLAGGNASDGTGAGDTPPTLDAGAGTNPESTEDAGTSPPATTDSSAAQSEAPEEPKEEAATEPEEIERDPPPPAEAPVISLANASASPRNSAADSPPPFMGARGKSGADGGRNVGGMKVKGSTLGVILDVSGSMMPYLDALRKEIEDQFPKAIFLEVRGCSVHPSMFNREEFEKSEIWKTKDRVSVMDAMRELVEYHGVDSIYWFSDLHDSRSKMGLDQLSALVRGEDMSRFNPTDPKFKPVGFDDFPGFKGEKKKSNLAPRGPSKLKRSAFHLYVRSSDKEPDDQLDGIITESGGAFQKK